MKFELILVKKWLKLGKIYKYQNKVKKSLKFPCINLDYCVNSYRLSFSNIKWQKK